LCGFAKDRIFSVREELGICILSRVLEEEEEEEVMG
jgi:hypothetical protein